MENFDFHVRTQILFGKNQIEALPKSLAPFGKKVLLVYGGGSIKKNGVYDNTYHVYHGYWAKAWLNWDEYFYNTVTKLKKYL